MTAYVLVVVGLAIVTDCPVPTVDHVEESLQTYELKPGGALSETVDEVSQAL
jgi:hypothetical protein